MTVERSVGLVGLGLVGQALGKRLCAQGWRTIGFDVRAEACDAFKAAGGEVVNSLADLGRSCSEVVLAVFDTRGVIDVLEAPGALLDAGHRVEGVIDCSTGSPEELQ